MNGWAVSLPCEIRQGEYPWQSYCSSSDTFLEASLLGAVLQWLAQNSELEDVSNPQALHAGRWWNSEPEDGVPGQIAFLESDGDPEDELDDYDTLPEGVGRWCIYWGGKSSSWLELRREHVRDALFVLLDHMKWRLEEGDLPDDPETRQEAARELLSSVARKMGGWYGITRNSCGATKQKEGIRTSLWPPIGNIRILRYTRGYAKSSLSNAR